MIKKNVFLNKPIKINAWIHSESTTTAEVLTNFNFDSITIDLQHGMLDFESCKNIIQIINMKKIFSIVRVPTNDIGIINKCLDAGARGIICPLINTENDCKVFLNNCYYPPVGKRSFGPTLASLNNKEYFEQSNEEVFSVVMIETKESVENLDKILSLSGLDAIYIGPYDLSINYGYSPKDVYKNTDMLKIYDDILRKAQNFNKITSIHCSGAETARLFVKTGFDIVTLSTDLNLLKIGVENEFSLLNKKN